MEFSSMGDPWSIWLFRVHSALVEDEHPKILFLEVDTYCIVQIT